MGPVKLKEASCALCKRFPLLLLIMHLLPSLTDIIPQCSSVSWLLLSCLEPDISVSPLTPPLPLSCHSFVGKTGSTQVGLPSAGSSHVLESKLNTSSGQPVFSLNIFPWQVMPASHLNQESEHHSVISFSL